jgi:hypothetical protein
MDDFQKRVIEERDDLEIKLGKLNKFMHGDIFAALPSIDYGLLMVQQGAMTMYLDALESRLVILDA